MHTSSFVPKMLTIFRAGYTRTDFRHDLIAGLTVAIVALPLAMALAIASGTSPDKGLVTAIIAGFLISLLGGSRVQIGGPTGAFVVVVFNVIAIHGYDGLILATLMAGAILVISGYARLGQVIKFIPHPVITGFTAGIAVIIASSQVKDFLGLRMEKVPADFIPKWGAYLTHLDSANLSALLIGLFSLVVIILLRRYAPKAPGYLIAVMVAAGAAALLHLPIETIGSRFPNLPSTLPMPHWPAIDFAKAREVMPSAFTIAFLAGIEALLSAVVADGMTGYRHRPNQELIAQGVANVASALFGGLPATGAIARTATNIKSGGRTPMAGMLHAVFLLIFMMFTMKIMAYVPMAALAAILFVVAWGMSEIHHFIHIFRLSKSDRVVLLLTFFLTVLVDLTVAIGVGVTLASLLFMRKMSKSVEIAAETKEAIVPEDELQRTDLPAGVEVFRIAGPVFFGVASDLMDALRVVGPLPRILIIRMRLVPYLDATGVTALKKLIDECHDAGTKVILASLQDQPRKILDRAGVMHGQGGVLMTNSYHEAVDLAHKI